MPTTGPGTAHRHKTQAGNWYDRTDVVSGSTHTHTVDLRALEDRIAVLEGLLVTEPVFALTNHTHPYAPADHTHAAPAPEPPPPVLADPVGFRRAFYDPFDYQVPRGQFVANPLGTYLGATLVQTPRAHYLVNNWATSHGGGRYDGRQIEVADGILDILVETRDGVAYIAGFKPIADVAVLATQGAIAGPFIIETRMRTDRLVGYKGVPLLWSSRPWRDLSWATGPDDVKWPDGEIDWPEGDFDRVPAAFFHWRGMTKNQEPHQSWFGSPAGTSWQDWHTYRTVFYPAGITGATWTPRVEAWLDGVKIAELTDPAKVAGNVPFRPNMQFEPRLVATKPDPAVRGHIQLDYIAIWVPS